MTSVTIANHLRIPVHFVFLSWKGTQTVLVCEPSTVRTHLWAMDVAHDWWLLRGQPPRAL